MQIVRSVLSVSDLANIAAARFGNMVKAVVDVEKRIMAIDADLHADEEAVLIENGSTQHTLWGINLYPDLYPGDGFIEFDSMINLRPSKGNMTRGVDDEHVRKKITDIVGVLISP